MRDGQATQVFRGRLKAKTTLEALRDDRALQDFASKHLVHPHQAGMWKRQEIKGLGEVFLSDVERWGHESELHTAQRSR